MEILAFALAFIAGYMMANRISNGHWG